MKNNDNFLKLKRIYELIINYEEEYGRLIALETIEVDNAIKQINTIDELLEVLENNKYFAPVGGKDES